MTTKDKAIYTPDHKSQMNDNPKKLSGLLPRGSIQRIAEQLGLTKQAVSDAIRRERPGHPAVIEAVRIARECGSLTAAQDLASLLPAA
ncbi:MAG: hypothetical protein ACRYFR_04750 [Janthinobacterium lividum]